MKNKKILYIILFCFLLMGGCAKNTVENDNIEPSGEENMLEKEDNAPSPTPAGGHEVSVTPTVAVTVEPASTIAPTAEATTPPAPTATPEPTATSTPEPTSTPTPLAETPKEAFKYSINNEEVTIEGLQNVDLTGIFIPATIDGCPVVKIADTAFYRCSNLEQVIISENMREIGAGAFALCTNLNSVTIPKSLVSIGSAAFSVCGFSEIELPEGLVSIGGQAFQGCANLKVINLPDSLEVIGEGAFQYTGIEQVIIPDGLKIISASVFADCKNLQSIYVGENVESIQELAFGNCPMLGEIIVAENNNYMTSRNEEGKECNAIIYEGFNGRTLMYGCANTVIPEDVECIGVNAFYGCQNLMKITIPKYVKEIRSGAFQGCLNLAYIVVDEENSVYTSRDDIGNECNVIIKKSEGCLIQGSLNGIIPQGVTEIAARAFYGTGISKVFIPESVRLIGDNAFAGCPNLEEITVDKRNLRYFSYNAEGKECNVIIDNEWFNIAHSCANTVIPEGVYNDILIKYSEEYFGETIDAGEIERDYFVSAIGEYAFFECEGLSRIKIPSNILSIGSYAFKNCDDLVTVIIEEGVEEIYEGAFHNCKNLKEITLPDTVSWIDEYAFWDCDGMESIVLPKGITEIKSGVFMGCDKLKFVTIPASVTSIEDWAFLYCTSLTTIYTPTGSYAEQWAIENGYEVINIQ